MCCCIHKHTYKHTHTVSATQGQQQRLKRSGSENENRGGQHDIKGRLHFSGEFCHLPILSNLESFSSRKKKKKKRLGSMQINIPPVD